MRIIELAMFVLVFNLACLAVQSSGAFPEGTNTTLISGGGMNSSAFATKINNTTYLTYHPPRSAPTTGTGLSLQDFVGIVIDTPTAIAYVIERAIPDDPTTGLPTSVESTISDAAKACCWILYIASLISLVVGYKVQD